MIDPPVDSDDGRLIFDAGVLAMNYSADYLLRAARNPDEGVSGAGSALPTCERCTCGDSLLLHHFSSAVSELSAARARSPRDSRRDAGATATFFPGSRCARGKGGPGRA